MNQVIKTQLINKHTYFHVKKQNFLTKCNQNYLFTLNTNNSAK